MLVHMCTAHELEYTSGGGSDKASGEPVQKLSERRTAPASLVTSDAPMETVASGPGLVKWRNQWRECAMPEAMNRMCLTSISTKALSTPGSMPGNRGFVTPRTTTEAGARTGLPAEFRI
jgi:hypothetical protein